MAALRTLVLPFGAVNGTRIILDGVNGQILAYDANDDLRFVLNPAGGIIELSSGGVNEELKGNVQASGRGSIGTTEQFLISLNSPKATNRQRAIIDLISESVDGTLETQIDTFANLLNVLDGGGGTTADIQLNGLSLPRGSLGKVEDTSSTAAFSAATTVLSGLDNIPVLAGRRYRVEFFARTTNISVALDTFELRIERDAGAGFATIQDVSLQPGTNGENLGGVHIVASYDPATNATVDFRVRGERISGTGTIAVGASATSPMYLQIEDIGEAN